jgi:hypothetical protein
VDSALIREVRRSSGPTTNPWTHYFPRLIASLDWFKRPGPLRQFRTTLPDGNERRFPRRHDVLILDEAQLEAVMVRRLKRDLPPRAFAKTMLKHIEGIERPPAPRVPTNDPVGLLQRRIEDLPEDPDDEQEWESLCDEVLDDASEALGSQQGPPKAERDLLEELGTWARENQERPDSKAEVFLKWLEETVRPGGKWGETRIILFTEYRDTQNWLKDLLADQGYVQGDRVMELHGSLSRDDREVVKAAFQASPKDAEVRILLATDAASEGLDLQNHCSRMLHYEIPWNPGRLEQRNGRIDRHGQRADKVEIFHFVGEGGSRRQGKQVGVNDLEDDLEFLLRIARKVDDIREDLGRVGTVLAKHIQAAMLGESGSAEDLDQALEKARPADPGTQLLQFDQDLEARLRELREQLAATCKQLSLTPDRIRNVVEVGLDLAHHPPLIPAKVEGMPEGSAWKLPPLPSSWAACGEGLLHPHTRKVRPLVFDPELARGRDEVVLCHLEYCLSQMCLRLLREQVFSPEGAALLARVTARKILPLEGANTEGDMVFAHARLVVLGATGERLREELLTVGGLLHPDGSWRRRIEGVAETERFLALGGSEAASEVETQRLTATWESQREPLKRALEQRMRERTRTLESGLEKQCAEEIHRVESVLAELRRRLKEELEGKDGFLQQTLFAEVGVEAEQKEELRRTREILEARLRSLPGEIEREVEQVRRRFEAPCPRLFPVCLTYLVQS